MSLVVDTSCGCGPPPHPALPLIHSGLAVLDERQPAGFAEYRLAMLSAIRSQSALSGWRAEGEGDLGVMLLECWAYVLDVTGFYDARVAERAFIGTAPDQAAAQRLAALLGHRPRGAMAARVKLALEADGADAVTVPRGTGFRSAAFGDEAPQIFELDADRIIWPQRNRWRLAPVRRPDFDGILRFMPRGAPPAGSVIVAAAGGKCAAARVLSAEPDVAADGARYERIRLDPDGAFATLKGCRLADLRVMILRLSLAPTSAEALWRDKGFAERTTIKLDSLYPQVRAGDRAALEIDGVLTPVTVEEVVRGSVPMTGGATMPVTSVTFSPAVVCSASQSLVFHADPFRIGAPTRPAETEVSMADIAAGGALAAPVPPLGEAPAGGEVILVGARERGVPASGRVNVSDDGAGRFDLSLGSRADRGTLAAPIDLFGNVVEAIRGETVVEEILGSADAATPFNSFRLRKQPLVWREDSAQPNGRRPDLAVRVGGVEWRLVDTFFGRGPEERVYVVRLEPDGGSRIIFGDGRRGARPPSGVDNIRAGYRHGAGSSTPPPGSISQLKGAVKGLAGVRGPLAAVGGADPESADALRTAAPAGALTLGRVISLADFEALARGFGAVNAAAGWIWDEGRQRAVVKLWIISGGAGLSERLAPWLAGQAVPDLAIMVEEAAALQPALAIALDVQPGYEAVAVRADARAALFDAEAGLLSPARQTIGAPLFRSVLVHRLHQVPGVRAVTAVGIDGSPMAYALAPGSGRWLDLESKAILS